MNLEQQVCSLDLAKRLKELGVKQESLFYWKYSGYNGEYEWHVADAHPGLDYPAHGWCSAFTVAELGEMLPSRVIVSDERYTLSCDLKDHTGWNCGLYHMTKGMYFGSNAETEADARAKMLIYLIENKLIMA